jgi:hypothetical protein
MELDTMRHTHDRRVKSMKARLENSRADLRRVENTRRASVTYASEPEADVKALGNIQTIQEHESQVMAQELATQQEAKAALRS